MNKRSLVKPTLTLITSALLLLAGHSTAYSNDANTSIHTVSKTNAHQAQQDAERLIDAAAGNRLSVIEQLVNGGININTPAIGDGTALMIAVKHNNLAMVDGLIGLGANVNQPSRGDGNPLIVASKQGHLAMVKHLLQQKAAIDAIVEGDETALINASRNGHFAIVKWLVEHGADVNLAVNAKTKSGMQNRSPLNQASSTSIQQYLLSQGATQ